MVWWPVNSELEWMLAEAFRCLIRYSILTFNLIKIEKHTRKNSRRSNQAVWRDFHWDLMSISKWLQHVTKMNHNRMQKIMLNYRPNGRRGLGSILEKLLDEVEIALSRINSWRLMVMMWWCDDLEHEAGFCPLQPGVWYSNSRFP
jgi:hypothetical protein